MLKRLEQEALQADLQAVEALLSAREPNADPIGYFQYERRRDALTRSLKEVEGKPSAASGAVALLFAGLPVVGSRGIKASFGSRAVDSFQTLVTNQVAAASGPVAPRGPVRQSERSTLIVSDVARGSFGFVLEEAGDDELIETPVSLAIAETLDLIFRSASEDEEEIDAMAAQIEERVLGALTTFFRVLDDAGAALKLITDKRQFSLDSRAIERARGRTEGIEIDEVVEHLTGRVYIEPISLRFGMNSEEAGSISGSIHPEHLRRLTGDQPDLPLGFADTERNATVRHRTIRMRNRAEKHFYKLIGSSD